MLITKDSYIKNMFNNLIGLICTLAFNMNIYPASTFFLVTWGKKIKIKII